MGSLSTAFDRASANYDVPLTEMLQVFSRRQLVANAVIAAGEVSCYRLTAAAALALRRAMFHLEINAVARRSFDEEILQSVLSVCGGERLFAHPAM